MAVYEYTAKDHSGTVFSGTYENIGSSALVREQLNKVGYVLVSAKRVKTISEKRRRVKRSDVVAFAYKFAGMYSAGLSILKCLETLEEQTENRTLISIIVDIEQQIETGSSLADAFAKHRGIFSDFFVGMVRAGESGGKLSEALQLSAWYLEKQVEVRQKIKSAFTYPVVVTVVCLLVISFLVAFVVPVFSKLYAQLHVPLPGPTQTLVNISSIVRNYWWLLLISAPTLVVLLRHVLRREDFRRNWDRFKLNMPVFGKLNRMVVVSHFTRTFSMLVSVGISMVDALETASRVAHNHEMTEIARDLQESVSAGNQLARSMAEHDIFPPILIQLAVSGEQAGKLSEMLNKAVEFIEKDIDRVIHSMLMKLEPALTLFMGIIVGFLLLGVYLPMYDYIGHFK